ncbi:uncharacterized protein C2orf42 homolog [Thalassophryne amazonica]|uniref:uncharacterized protein C2orf42 homolog n=1 Tax=Thalassophryne amazonica TaxID=390379 RepID=UPI0014724A4C|nr:uncharacterized protein C2orf42 homolog [Thalassophryne amazonica]
MESEGVPSTSGVTSDAAASSSARQTSTAQPSLAAKQRENRKSATTTPAFLSNLGKPTLRGIRRCPQCGIYNGTRGLSCKNKACGISLRDGSSGSRSQKAAVEVVKVITDSDEGQAGGGGGSRGGAQVFSVCYRGRGATATQLGFVELVPTDTAIATGDGATLLTRINLGRCFMPLCRQGQRSESAPSASKQACSSDSLCIHIKQAMECQSRAAPLTLKSSTLEGLQASFQAREELWRLATESPGPLVQRVAKDTMVVKCHTDANHPLGLLHLTVGAGGLAEESKSERRARGGQQNAVFHCSCQSNSRRAKPGVDSAAGPDSSSNTPPISVTPKCCLHFYACVCAFASDDKLASEFTAFIKYSPRGAQRSVECRVISPTEKSVPQQPELHIPHQKGKRLRLDETISGGSGNTQVVDERTVTLTFHRWLASVTERIHQTMHYQFDGKPETSVYYIPQEFFNALQHRLSLGSKKRRLPNFTTAFVRNDGLPLGSFSKYTWHITNPMQVKHIFDTPELPLELTQNFVKNADGSYSCFQYGEPLPRPELPEAYRTDRSQVISPMELHTFLKVGPSTGRSEEASPFVIEWIPDVLPGCRVGELRICFEFGHQQRGQQEHFDGHNLKSSATEKGAQNKSESTPSKAIQGFEILRVVV